MKHIFSTVILLALVSTISASAQGLFHLSFATAEQAQVFITTKDHYTSGLSQFDIDSRLGHTNGTMLELSELQKRECRDWSQAEKDTLIKTFALLEKKLSENGFHIPVPQKIVLIKTTMHEEGDAGAYTRANMIYFGEDSFGHRTTSERLLSLVAHELFHVLTRNDLKFKTEMYKTIGFTRLKKEIKFPEELLSRRISNPDVSCYDSYAMLDIDGQKLPCTMINVANRAYEGGSFFRYLKVGFIPLDKKHRPIQENGVTIVYDLDKAANFYDLVGKNTGYVINPEECLADNFAIAVAGSSRAPRTPELIDAIQQVLRTYKVKK